MTNRFCGLPEKARGPSELGPLLLRTRGLVRSSRAYDATHNQTRMSSTLRECSAMKLTK
jgi:hypothetical protein